MKAWSVGADPNHAKQLEDSQELSSNKMKTVKNILSKISCCMKKKQPKSGTLRVWKRHGVLILLILELNFIMLQ